MPELRMARRVKGATEVITVRMAGAAINYWPNKQIRARDDDPNQTPWVVFSIREIQGKRYA